MYFPVLRNNFAERTACRELSSFGRFCSPTFCFKSPKDPTDKRAMSRLKGELQRIAATSVHLKCIGISGDDAVLDWLPTQVESLGPGTKLRLVLNESQLDKYASLALDFHKYFRSGASAILPPSSDRDPAAIAKVKQLQAAILPFDVLVDFKRSMSDVGSFADLAALKLRRLRKAGLRNLVFLSGAYPDDNSGMGQGIVTDVPRFDWLAFQAIQSMGVKVRFGDYASVSHRERPGDSSPIKTHYLAIRYTDHDCWRVHRAAGCKRDAWAETFHRLALDLVSQPYYMTSSFSWGDKRLAEAAQSSANAPTDWKKIRAIELNHHMSAVALATVQPAAGQGPDAVPTRG